MLDYSFTRSEPSLLRHTPQTNAVELSIRRNLSLDLNMNSHVNVDLHHERPEIAVWTNNVNEKYRSGLSKELEVQVHVQA